MLKNKVIDVSVCCITFNHQHFIIDALKSFVEQITNFEFEIVISDDGSTDKTVELIEEFKLQSSIKIRIVKNLVKKGVGGNFLNGFNNCNSKYIAICEGDDYWVGSDKLQKQFDFLERNTEVSVCGHLSYKLVDSNIKVYNLPTERSIYSLTEYLRDPFFHTSSFFFSKKTLLSKIPDWYTDLYSVDNFTILLLSMDSRIGMINEYLSVYRINSYSISNKYNIIFISKNYIMHLEKFNKLSNFKFDKEIQKVILQWQLRSNYLLPRSERYLFLKENIGHLFRQFKFSVSVKLLFKYLLSYAFKIR